MTARPVTGWWWAAAALVIGAVLTLAWFARPRPSEPSGPMATAATDAAEVVRGQRSTTRPRPALPGYGSPGDSSGDGAEPSGGDDMGQRPLAEVSAEANRGLEQLGQACAQAATGGGGTLMVNVRYALAVTDGEARLVEVRATAGDAGLERCILAGSDRVIVEAPGAFGERMFAHSFRVQVVAPR